MNPRQIPHMPDSLDRKALPVRLADLIETEIRAGNWSDSLPGHRALMDRYSVSAKTSLGAISLLEERGLVSHAEHGRKRRIQATLEKSEPKLKGLLIIDGRGSQSGEDLQQLQAYRNAWEDAGGSVQTIRLDFPRYRRPASLLREAVSNYKADAMLLHVPPLAWGEAAAKIRPVFLAGGEWRGNQITGAAYNLADEVSHWVEKLRALGHQRVVVPLDLIGREMENAVREALATGLEIRTSSPDLHDYCPVFTERVPAAWQQYWKRVFATVRPTAIIVTDDIHYLSLSGYCSRHGIRIPNDLSVICLESTEHLEWCEPVPTRMRYPIEAATKYFKKWIRSGCKPMGMKFFPLDCIEAGSVAGPSRR